MCLAPPQRPGRPRLRLAIPISLPTHRHTLLVCRISISMEMRSRLRRLVAWEIFTGPMVRRAATTKQTLPTLQTCMALLANMPRLPTPTLKACMVLLDSMLRPPTETLRLSILALEPTRLLSTVTLPTSIVQRLGMTRVNTIWPTTRPRTSRAA